jgi:integrase
MASGEFKALDVTNTQRPRRGILERTWTEPIQPGSEHLIGDCLVARMSPAIFRMLRTRIAAGDPKKKRKSGGPDAANNMIKAVRAVFKWAIEEELAETNPARDVSRLKTRVGGFHSWSEDEVQQYEDRWPIGTKERLALGLLRYLGVRRSDVVRLGKQHVKIQAGKVVIRFAPHKGRKHYPQTLDLPMPAALQAVIDASPTGDLTFLVTEFRKPYTDAGFGNWFRERCNKAELPQCSAHGLRKLAATSLAEAGATAHQLMAWFGWKSINEAEIYTRAANQKKLANSVAPLIGGSNG